MYCQGRIASMKLAQFGLMTQFQIHGRRREHGEAVLLRHQLWPHCGRSAKHSCRWWLCLRGLLLLHNFHFSWGCSMLQVAYGLKVLSHRLCSAGRLLQQSGFGLHCQSYCLTPQAEEAVGWVEVSCVLLGGAKWAGEAFALNMGSLNVDSVLLTAPSLCK